MDSKVRQEIIKELETLNQEMLLACRNILELNLKGILVGDRTDTEERLDLIYQELGIRALTTI